MFDFIRKVSRLFLPLILLFVFTFGPRVALAADVSSAKDVLAGQRTLYRINDLGLWGNGYQYGYTLVEDNGSLSMQQLWSSQIAADFVVGTGLFGKNGNFEVLVSSSGTIYLNQNGQTVHQTQWSGQAKG